MEAVSKAGLARVMLVTDRARAGGGDLVEQVGRAVDGGVGLVQVREKDLADDELVRLVEKIRVRVGDAAVVLVNGRAEVARRTGCGLHLPAAQVGVERGGIPVVGRSAHDVAEVERAVGEGCDYIVLGTVYPTPSKPGHPGIGPRGLEALVEAARGIPTYGIGGIRPGYARHVVDAGCYGVAVCGVLLGAERPEEVARRLLEEIGGRLG